MTNAQPYISEPKGSPNSHLRRVQNQRDELKAINAELLEALQEAFTLHDKGELCSGGLLRAEWAEKARDAIDKATQA